MLKTFQHVSILCSLVIREFSNRHVRYILKSAASAILMKASRSFAEGFLSAVIMQCLEPND
jgi:hypothetical protein